MDKIAKYREAILSFFNNYLAETAPMLDSTVEYSILSDKENLNFQLLSSGWRGKHFVFGPLFHFEIKNEKIWMQCNNTEREVVDELMANGINKQDIVLGFLPPYAREHSGFAVA